MNDKKQYRKPAAIEVVHKPQLKSLLVPRNGETLVHTDPVPVGYIPKFDKPKLTLADRIRNAVGAPTDLSPKAVRAYLHGLKINLRNLANEVEKLESELKGLRALRDMHAKAWTETLKDLPEEESSK